ncbi:MAG: hypothetical protein HKN44_08795 [Ilumatobacter sp.]|nr:hypothetical protein [Ilumatobacter sp.]
MKRRIVGFGAGQPPTAVRISSLAHDIVRATRATVAVLAAFAMAPPALAAEPPTVGEPGVVVTFDRSAGRLPDGLAVDRVGNTYVGLVSPFRFPQSRSGEVWRFDPDGNPVERWALGTGATPAGVVVDRHGTVFVTVAHPAQESSGIHRLRSGGGHERLPGSERMFEPKGLTVDWSGTLYATDSARGQVWRVDGADDRAELWLSHPLLQGCGRGGASGLVVRGGALFVANPDRGLVVRVDLGVDGSAREPRIVAGDVDCEISDVLWGVDDLAFDVRRDLYATLASQNRLVRIDREGSVEVVLTAADGLWHPTSLAFGTRDRRMLFIANSARRGPEPADSVGPAIIETGVGTRGQMVPCRCPAPVTHSSCPLDVDVGGLGEHAGAEPEWRA